MGTENELVAVVDAEDTVVGAVTRQEMRAKALIHRAVYVLVFDSRGDVFVQRRSSGKDVYPGRYDVAAGGVVLARETYEAAAARELAEELGIRGVVLTRFLKFYHGDGENRVWGEAYTCVYEGPMELDDDEVDSGRFLPVEQVLEMSGRESFAPDSLFALKAWLARAGGAASVQDGKP